MIKTAREKINFVAGGLMTVIAPPFIIHAFQTLEANPFSAYTKLSAIYLSVVCVAQMIISISMLIAVTHYLASSRTPFSGPSKN